MVGGVSGGHVVDLGHHPVHGGVGDDGDTGPVHGHGEVGQELELSENGF